MHLTDLEKTVLQAVATYAGRDAIADFQDDNHSWVEVSDIVTITGLPMPTVRGVVGSLCAKGIMGSEPSANDRGDDLLYIVERMIPAAVAAGA